MRGAIVTVGRGGRVLERTSRRSPVGASCVLRRVRGRERGVIVEVARRGGPEHPTHAPCGVVSAHLLYDEGTCVVRGRLTAAEEGLEVLTRGDGGRDTLSANRLHDSPTMHNFVLPCWLLLVLGAPANGTADEVSASISAKEGFPAALVARPLTLPDGMLEFGLGLGPGEDRPDGWSLVTVSYGLRDNITMSLTATPGYRLGAGAVWSLARGDRQELALRGAWPSEAKCKLPRRTPS
jgi:hypothetical protein